ncbi:MAG: hypothetical protein JWR69_2373 [Pedosphaera sp.]|nr:hypothetical protein [Pedosphaera sp.]
MKLKNSRPSRSWRRIAVILFVATLLAGASRAGSLREPDISETPEMAAFAKEARQLCDEVYPKILNLMAEDPAKLPQQFDLIFRHDQAEPGLTAGTKIYLSSDWFTKHPNDLGALVHEMAHVAQQYAPGAPGHWTEGIADYVRYTLGYTNGWSYPHCSAEFPHYTSGYWCTSAFLMYVEATYGTKVIRRFNEALRQGSYSDAFFAQATGKGIDTLWADFQKTAAYQPSAAAAFKAQALRAQKDKDACTGHLLEIEKAIRAYEKDNHALPNWLSDLVPKYIADTNVLVCPVTQRTGKTANFGIVDPGLPNVYLYEFSASKIPWGADGGDGGPTMKEYKLRQKELVGVGVPLIRCHLHEPVLNLSFNGRIYESPLGWEGMFTNAVVHLEDLYPNRIFPQGKD